MIRIHDNEGSLIEFDTQEKTLTINAAENINIAAKNITIEAKRISIFKRKVILPKLPKAILAYNLKAQPTYKPLVMPV